MEIEKYTEGNRKAFNEANVFHNKAKGDYYKNKFLEKDFTALDDLEKQIFQKINVKGKKIAQLCCNNGRELISIIKLGAKEGTGFDISDAAIADAKEFADIAKVNCDFICTDVYSIGEKYSNVFDIIYISAGSLNWLPNIEKFFKVINRLLKKGGRLFIYEIHPFSEVFASSDNNKFDSNNPYKITKSYFDNSAQMQETGIDYIGKEKYKSETNYWFTHTMSDIINGCIRNDIRITELKEYPFDVSAVLEHLQKDKLVPLSFSLLGIKE
ncbi:MAG: class I SAM-dependent methyltransferase [archaeon]